MKVEDLCIVQQRISIKHEISALSNELRLIQISAFSDHLKISALFNMIYFFSINVENICIVQQ